MISGEAWQRQVAELKAALPRCSYDDIEQLAIAGAMLLDASLFLYWLHDYRKDDDQWFLSVIDTARAAYQRCGMITATVDEAAAEIERRAQVLNIDVSIKQ